MSEVLDIAALNLSALPNGWHYKAVSEIGATGEQPVLTGPFGTNLGRGDFVASGVPLLTIGCLTQGGINLEKALFVSEEKAKELSRYRLKEGDLLFSRMASVGRAGLVPKWLEGALFNYHIMRLRLDESRIDTRLFINYVRGAKQVRDYLKAVNHGATRDGINTEQLLGLPVAVPPLTEQREIVAELEKQFSRLDEAVANLQRVKANLKRYKASVLKAAVEGRLVETEATLAHRESRTYETGEQLLRAALIARRARWDRRGQYVEPKATASDELSSLPDGWVWANVEQLGFVRGGKRLPAGHKYAEEVTPHPYIRVTDFADYGINLDGLLYLKPETHKEIQRYTILSDDLYISIAGSIGLVGVLPERLSGANLTENAAKITGLEHVQKEYLMYWLSSASGIDFISDSTIATTQAKLALYRIERIPVPLPPLAEQARIIAEVDRHLSIIREVESEVDANLQRAQALRQSTLSSAFSPKP